VRFDHAPKWTMQPPSKVAKAVVKCLKHPRPEVWTSAPARAGICLGLLFPSLTDFFLRSYVKKRQALLDAKR